MTAEKNALRVRNSIVRSFRAISQAARRVSATGQRLSIRPRVRSGIDTLGPIVPNELAPLHHRRMSGERQSLDEVVGDYDDGSSSRTKLREQCSERANAAVVESTVWLVGEDELRSVDHRSGDRDALLHTPAQGANWG